MMLLKNPHDIDTLIQDVDRCRGDVILRSGDGSAEYNLKSTLSRYIAIGELLKPHGDEYEFFCERRSDEVNIVHFLNELKGEALSA